MSCTISRSVRNSELLRNRFGDCELSPSCAFIYAAPWPLSPADESPTMPPMIPDFGPAATPNELAAGRTYGSAHALARLVGTAVQMGFIEAPIILVAGEQQ